MRCMGASMWPITSQTSLEHKSSPRSENATGVSGEPWVQAHEGGEEDDFEALDEGRWQVHVYGEVEREVRHALQGKGWDVRKFEWRLRERKG